MKDSMRNVPVLSINTVLSALGALPSFKDKAFYSLLAASGCRTDVALQLRMGDVDTGSRKVKFFRPDRQKLSPAYMNATPPQRGKRVREADSAVEGNLIEPFAEFFFYSLSKYLKEECERDGQGGAFLLFPRTPRSGNGGPQYRGGGWPNAEMFRDAMRKAGFEGDLTEFRLISFRRLFCDLAFQNLGIVHQGGHPKRFLPSASHLRTEQLSRHLGHISAVSTRYYVPKGPAEESQHARDERISQCQDALVEGITQHLKLEDTNPL